MEVFMFRGVVKVLLVLLFVGFISSQVSAQVFSPTSNIGQHIVGTWTDLGDNGVVVFNADGTGSWSGSANRWAVIGNTIAFVYPRNTVTAFEITISNDGRFLILSTSTGTGRLLQKR